MKKLTDYILTVDNLMSDDLIERLISEYSDESEWLAYSENYHGKASGKGIFVCNPEVIGDSKSRKILSEEITSSFSKAFEAYKKKYSRVNEEGYDYLMLEKINPIRLLRYSTGHYLGNHIDKLPDVLPNQPGWPVVSCSMCVNSDYRGGNMILIDGDISVEPKSGRAILFPSNFLFPHAIDPIISGTRYVLVSWAW